MEEVFQRFRHLGEQIFKRLDTESLNKCTEVDKSWNEFVSTWKLPWIRMIQNYVKTTGPEWREFFRKANIEKLKIIVEAIVKAMPDYDDFFPHNGTPLILAAMSGNVEIVAELLETESKKKQPEDHNGRTPLHYAASNGHLRAFQMIVEKFGEWKLKDIDGYTPLHEAACNGHFEVCKFIVEMTKNYCPNGFILNELNEYGVTPFQRAAEGGELEVCKLLIDNAANKNPETKNGRTLLHDLVYESSCLDACRLIIERIDDKLPRDGSDTPLHLAADAGNIEMCQMIVNSLSVKNPVIDADGTTLLHSLAYYNLVEPYRMVMERVDNKNPIFLYGCSPLHIAAENGHLEVCSLIIASVKDKNPEDASGYTPLHYAAQEGHLSICKLVINIVTDKNPKNEEGNTPLHEAAEKGHFGICKLIVQNVKEIHPKNRDGKTPYDMALEKGNMSVTQLLKYPFLSIPGLPISSPHLPPGFWGIGE